MSKIEVNTIDAVSGTSTLTLGSSNASTIALGSGDVQSNFNYPSFHVTMSANQTSISSDTNVTVQFDTETYDTDSAYDTSTYTFTVPSGKAGKYFFCCGLGSSTMPADTPTFVGFSINGTVKAQNKNQNSTTTTQLIQSSAVFNLSSGNTVKVNYKHGANQVEDLNTSDNVFFSGFRIGT
jgi:hypothetical protein